MMSDKEVPSSIEIYRSEHTTRNLERWSSCFTEGATVVRTGRPPFIGRKRIEELIREWTSNSRKYTLMKHLNTMCAGNLVAIEWETIGEENNGKALRMTGVNIYELENGKIKYLHIYRDV